MPGDPTPVERRKVARFVTRLSLRLEAENAPGGVAVEERTITDDVSQWGAQVRAWTRPDVKGAILHVQEIDGDFRTRAEVRNISIGPDGHPRLEPALPRLPRPRADAAGRRGGRDERSLTRRLIGPALTPSFRRMHPR